MRLVERIAQEFNTLRLDLVNRFNTLRGDTVEKTAPTGSVILPVGGTSERDVVPEEGFIRFNSDTREYEGFRRGVWSSVGGGQLLGTGDTKGVQYMANKSDVGETITIGSNLNAFSVHDFELDNADIVVENNATYSVL